MESIEADPEDRREILRAVKIIQQACIENNLVFAYVMEALQGLYASKAREVVSYEVYCQKIEQHKEYYKSMWERNP